MHSAFEAIGETFKTGGLAEEGEPLRDGSRRFVVFEHSSSVMDEVVEVLLHGSGHESDEQTYSSKHRYLAGSSRKEWSPQPYARPSRYLSTTSDCADA